MTALLTVDDVAERLAMSPGWVREQIATRELGAVRLGNRVRVTPEQLAAFLAARIVTTPAKRTPLPPARGSRRVRTYG